MIKRIIIICSGVCFSIMVGDNLTFEHIPLIYGNLLLPKRGDTFSGAASRKIFLISGSIYRLGLFLDQIGLNTRSFKRTWIWTFGFFRIPGRWSFWILVLDLVFLRIMSCYGSGVRKGLPNYISTLLSANWKRKLTDIGF